jgi:hypothetical protein
MIAVQDFWGWVITLIITFAGAGIIGKFKHHK